MPMQPHRVARLHEDRRLATETDAGGVPVVMMSPGSSFMKRLA